MALTGGTIKLGEDMLAGSSGAFGAERTIDLRTSIGRARSTDIGTGSRRFEYSSKSFARSSASGAGDGAGGRSPPRPPPPAESRLVKRMSSREKLESLPMRCAGSLDWTSTPIRTVEEDASGVRYQVSVPSSSGPRMHKPHLKQTVRLDPQGGKPPPMPAKAEKIVVKESDLRKFGNDLNMLREVQVHPESPGSSAEANKNFNLSFKSAFAQRCRADAVLRDPWEGMKNPEFSRDHYESDLVLNQIWVDAIPASKKAIEISKELEEAEEGEHHDELYSPMSARMTSTPSSASARSQSMGPRTSSGGAAKVDHPSSRRRGRRNSERSSSERPGSVPHFSPKAEDRSSERREKRSSSHTRGARPPPGEDRRIRPLEEVLGSEEDDDKLVGSLAVRAATKAQRAGLRQLEDKLYYDDVPRAAWVSMDIQTGKISFYPKAQAERLEAAYRNGRASVPLAGLGKEVDSSIVTFARSQDLSSNFEQNLQGKSREVQRIAVPSSLYDAHLVVLCQEGRWRFVSEKDRADLIAKARDEGEDPPEFEEKVVNLYGAELVSLPDKLPPVNRNQRTYFLNQSFFEYY